MAWINWRLTGVPFVFDIRGFLPQEYLDVGYWKRDDLRYRILAYLEGVLLRDATEIVVLTRAARRTLLEDARYARRLRVKPITVVPCAVDLERFSPSDQREHTPTLVYSGSLGSWYQLDEMLKVFKHAKEREPRLKFLILNQTDHSLIADALARLDIDPSSVIVRAVPFERVQEHLRTAHVAIALVRQSPSKIASSAIKIAEYLACGLPVVVNRGLGDVDTEILEARAGHITRSYSSEELERTGDAVVSLLNDAGARHRARQLAESAYDLQAALRIYKELYARVATRSTSST
jgi:glycosyltransferase involved in cell wall biosynthesis